uniref:Uncharacterized protein n=1 Tax=Chromera velia CCMP2878 TaxID=1169474 RepID=A0A0G4I613_9ALVE|eukprot:Cvel_75.t1-p1 / transcript=Cvel_75.t1 / gene=Cvel_75 / organism=Chromera_velia_CCMP2878 / gene_product=hypothetical protein / transcript_product=hypothetical protein / location=Cvel_scaffold6:198302-207251(-) / protein_length=1725 / sequence_SO=supercontig / SO=protein_coding / is_pseudo=false
MRTKTAQGRGNRSAALSSSQTSMSRQGSYSLQASYPHLPQERDSVEAHNLARKSQHHSTATRGGGAHHQQQPQGLFGPYSLVGVRGPGGHQQLSRQRSEAVLHGGRERDGSRAGLSGHRGHGSSLQHSSANSFHPQRQQQQRERALSKSLRRSSSALLDPRGSHQTLYGGSSEGLWGNETYSAPSKQKGGVPTRAGPGTRIPPPPPGSSYAGPPFANSTAVHRIILQQQQQQEAEEGGVFEGPGGAEGGGGGGGFAAPPRSAPRFLQSSSEAPAEGLEAKEGPRQSHVVAPTGLRPQQGLARSVSASGLGGRGGHVTPDRGDRDGDREREEGHWRRPSHSRGGQRGAVGRERESTGGRGPGPVDSGGPRLASRLRNGKGSSGEPPPGGSSLQKRSPAVEGRGTRPGTRGKEITAKGNLGTESKQDDQFAAGAEKDSQSLWLRERQERAIVIGGGGGGTGDTPPHPIARGGGLMDEMEAFDEAEVNRQRPATSASGMRNVPGRNFESKKGGGSRPMPLLHERTLTKEKEKERDAKTRQREKQDRERDLPGASSAAYPRPHTAAAASVGGMNADFILADPAAGVRGGNRGLPDSIEVLCRAEGGGMEAREDVYSSAAAVRGGVRPGTSPLLSLSCSPEEAVGGAPSVLCRSSALEPQPAGPFASSISAGEGPMMAGRNEERRDGQQRETAEGNVSRGVRPVDRGGGAMSKNGNDCAVPPPAQQQQLSSPSGGRVSEFEFEFPWEGKVKIYSDLFNEVISRDSAFGSLLTKIKDGYEACFSAVRQAGRQQQEGKAGEGSGNSESGGEKGRKGSGAGEGRSPTSAANMALASAATTAPSSRAGGPGGKSNAVVGQNGKEGVLSPKGKDGKGVKGKENDKEKEGTSSRSKGKLAAAELEKVGKEMVLGGVSAGPVTGADLVRASVLGDRWDVGDDGRAALLERYKGTVGELQTQLLQVVKEHLMLRTEHVGLLAEAEWKRKAALSLLGEANVLGAEEDRVREEQEAEEEASPVSKRSTSTPSNGALSFGLGMTLRKDRQPLQQRERPPKFEIREGSLYDPSKSKKKFAEELHDLCTVVGSLLLEVERGRERERNLEKALEEAKAAAGSSGTNQTTVQTPTGSSPKDRHHPKKPESAKDLKERKRTEEEEEQKKAPGKEEEEEEEESPPVLALPQRFLNFNKQPIHSNEQEKPSVLSLQSHPRCPHDRLYVPSRLDSVLPRPDVSVAQGLPLRRTAQAVNGPSHQTEEKEKEKQRKTPSASAPSPAHSTPAAAAQREHSLQRAKRSGKSTSTVKLLVQPLSPDEGRKRGTNAAVKKKDKEGIDHKSSDKPSLPPGAVSSSGRAQSAGEEGKRPSVNTPVSPSSARSPLLREKEKDAATLAYEAAERSKAVVVDAARGSVGAEFFQVVLPDAGQAVVEQSGGMLEAKAQQEAAETSRRAEAAAKGIVAAPSGAAGAGAGGFSVMLATARDRESDSDGSQLPSARGPAKTAALQAAGGLKQPMSKRKQKEDEGDEGIPSKPVSRVIRPSFVPPLDLTRVLPTAEAAQDLGLEPEEGGSVDHVDGAHGDGDSGDRGDEEAELRQLGLELGLDLENAEIDWSSLDAMSLQNLYLERLMRMQMGVDVDADFGQGGLDGLEFGELDEVRDHLNPGEEEGEGGRSVTSGRYLAWLASKHGLVEPLPHSGELDEGLMPRFPPAPLPHLPFVLGGMEGRDPGQHAARGRGRGAGEGSASA